MYLWSHICVWCVLCCCLHGVIKLDDDDDDDNAKPLGKALVGIVASLVQISLVFLFLTSDCVPFFQNDNNY